MDAEKKMGAEIDLIKEGDEVLLYVEKEHFFIVEVKKDGIFSFHKGKIELNFLIGKPYGSIVRTNKGYKLFVFRPTIADRILKLKRKTQIMYPKDIGIILLKSGIGNGSKVIEIGCGSGAFTIALAHRVAPDGMVYAYDSREEFLELAMKNVERAGLSKYVRFMKRDIKEGFDVYGVKAVFVDLPEPWNAVKPARESLENGGIFVSLSPTFNQIEKTAVALEKEGFAFLEAFEVLTRRILARENKTRPFERMVSHTGFIIMARKAEKEEE